ncbi:MAG: hypothetical protein LCI00_32170 [Chloroflexi bacterium]|nr:hypothetical protein [Chloroflexota bacterium]MCC6894233.1 hypothetical protein [Anaerolineae bacterium]
MRPVFILAHGALGEWDELVFLSIAAIFLVMMGISWVRSRVSTPEELEATTEQPTETTEPTQGRFPLE